MTHTREQLREIYKNLPEEIKDALDSVELLDLIEEIGKKFHLHIDQQGKISNEIGLMLFGITRPENFIDKLIKAVELTPEVAGEITKELNTKIFFPIRKSIERVHSTASQNAYHAAPAPQVEHFSPAGNVSSGNIEKTESPLRTPDNNAIIVGSTAPMKTPDQVERDLFDEKMGKLFRIPKEELELGEASNNKPPTSTDPYRENTN